MKKFDKLNVFIRHLKVGRPDLRGESIMYEKVKQALNEKGELMILTDSGEEHELHLHNVQFKDDGIIKVNADNETHWLNGEKIESYWIHEDF